MGRGRDAALRLKALESKENVAPDKADDSSAVNQSDNNANWDLLVSILKADLKEFTENSPSAKLQGMKMEVVNSGRLKICTVLRPLLNIELSRDFPLPGVQVRGSAGDLTINSPVYSFCASGFDDNGVLYTPLELSGVVFSIIEEFFAKLVDSDEVITARKQRGDALRRQGKLLGCIVGVLYAVFALSTATQRGNGIFVLIIAGFTLVSSWPDPGNLKTDLSSPFRMLWAAIRKVSFRAFLFAISELLRQGFRRSDAVVRFLLITISLGGTAVVMKYGIRNFFLPDIIDVWVKRLGPAFAILVVILFPCYMISKKIFLLSMNEKDESCRRYELLFYSAVILFCITELALFVGLPFRKDYGRQPSHSIETRRWAIDDVELSARDTLEPLHVLPYMAFLGDRIRSMRRIEIRGSCLARYTFPLEDLCCSSSSTAQTGHY